MMTQPKSKKSQADKFREAAKELETDDDEKRFDERLKKIAEKNTEKDPRASPNSVWDEAEKCDDSCDHAS